MASEYVLFVSVKKIAIPANTQLSSKAISYLVPPVKGLRANSPILLRFLLFIPAIAKQLTTFIHCESDFSMIIGIVQFILHTLPKIC